MFIATAHATPPRWLLMALAGLVASLATAGPERLVRYAAAPASGSERRLTVKDEAWPVPDAVLRSGTLSFTGHSTPGTFVGTTTVVKGSIEGSGDVVSARGWVEAPVATLSTHNGHRDSDLRASMEVDKYPTMRFDLTSVTLDSPGVPPDTVRTTLHGRLTIHGIVHEVSLPATLAVNGGAIDVTGGFPLDLADYRIGGLTRFLGALRMQRNIEVTFRLRFEATPHAMARERER